MNFLAIPTLKNVRACLRLPSSMMPRLALKFTLARLRTGIDSVGSLLRSAAVITASATLTSFFSTAPVFFGLARAIYLVLRLDVFTLGALRLATFGLRLTAFAAQAGLALPLAFPLPFFRVGIGLSASRAGSGKGVTSAGAAPGKT